MQALASLCSETSVRTAIIVDDGYDTVPRASDFALDGQEWTIFFDDATDADRAKFREIFPPYPQMQGTDLKNSDEFIKALWERRAEIRPDLINPFFERYVTDKEGDAEYLKIIESFLTTIGVSHSTTGRDFVGKAKDVDLIIIDLYLDSIEQNKNTLAISRDGLRSIVEGRRSNPPLVVLMSRNPSLLHEQADFRDKAQLPESVFRIISKEKLRDQSIFLRLLTRLVRHYPDSRKLAAFINSWHEGLGAARDRTCELIRKIDLADCAQINQLLLDSEREPLGNYLVDIFDRVLQHEIERDESIIQAAKGLNQLNCKSYPPPHIEDTPAFQALIFEALYQNAERLTLNGDKNISFGDILMRKSPIIAPSEAPIHLPDITATEVLVALTPACDLQRQGVSRVMFLCGSLEPLKSFQAIYTSNAPRTPIILIGSQRMWIKWDLKHIETLSFKQIDNLLSTPDGLNVIGRLRESHALELQQKLLSSLGRVGQPAPMPTTLLVNLEVCVLLSTGKLSRLDIPSLRKTPCVSYSGRVQIFKKSELTDKRESRILIYEKTCEEICLALSQVDISTIHSACVTIVNQLRDGLLLLDYLESGIVYPTNLNDFEEIKFPQVSSGASPTIGLIRVGEMTELKPSQFKSAGVVLFLKHID